MLKILNIILAFLKVILLLVFFVFTFYIIINISNFLPFFILFILFSINFIFRQKSVNDNIFYNLTCCLAFTMLGFCIYRALKDDHMIIILRQGYDINFNYFADIVAPMKFIIYYLSLFNILLMLDGSKIFNNDVKKIVKRKH